VLVCILAVAAAAPGAGASPRASGNLVQTAVAAGQFKTLVSLVKQAGLVGALSGRAKLTIFAPTDAAFAKVPKATLAKLAANPAKLKAVLLYHVVKGDVTAAQAMKLHSATTLEGQMVKLATRGGAVYVNGAKVVKPNVLASNGVIHVIDKVLLPPSM
jgi:uncharacterized surface protein with fasciclin (FAS1) repeats